jgi:hypothetical protein
MKRQKLPKSVLGVKLPKAVRNSRAAKKLLNDAPAREILTGALVAGATAAAAALARNRSTSGNADTTGVSEVPEASFGANNASDAAQEAANVLSAAITSLVTGLQPNDSAKRVKKVHKGTKGKADDTNKREPQPHL